MVRTRSCTRFKPGDGRAPYVHLLPCIGGNCQELVWLPYGGLGFWTTHTVARLYYSVVETNLALSIMHVAADVWNGKS